MDETRRQLLRSWLTKAANDLKSARVLRADPEGPLDSATYHCQQAGEKAVKAFWCSRKSRPPRRTTFASSRLKLPRLSRSSTNSFLPPYAWEFRYPDDLAET